MGNLNITRATREYNALLAGYSSEERAFVAQLAEKHPDAKLIVPTPGTKTKSNGVDGAAISALGKEAVWDRTPDTALLQARADAARARRKKALDQGRRILERRTIGNDDRVRRRLEAAAAVIAAIHAAEAAELKAELALLHVEIEAQAKDLNGASPQLNETRLRIVQALQSRIREAVNG
jgi:hypothetical protein